MVVGGGLRRCVCGGFVGVGMCIFDLAGSLFHARGSTHQAASSCLWSCSALSRAVWISPSPGSAFCLQGPPTLSPSTEQSETAWSVAQGTHCSRKAVGTMPPTAATLNPLARATISTSNVAGCTLQTSGLGMTEIGTCQRWQGNGCHWRSRPAL